MEIKPETIQAMLNGTSNPRYKTQKVILTSQQPVLSFALWSFEFARPVKYGISYFKFNFGDCSETVMSSTWSRIT